MDNKDRYISQLELEQKSRHQAARGALNKLPEATGAHGAPQIPLEGVQGVMLISTG